MLYNICTLQGIRTMYLTVMRAGGNTGNKNSNQKIFNVYNKKKLPNIFIKRLFSIRQDK